MTSFAPIPGVPQSYIVDSEGNVYGPRGALKQRAMGARKMYARFSYWDADRQAMRDMSWHRAVYSAFCGSPGPGLVVRHIDGNPRNNKLDNLSSGTQKQNLSDRADHGTMTRGGRNGNSKLTDDAVHQIRERYSIGDCSMRQLGDEFGVNASVIWRVVHRAGWAHVS